LLEQAMKTERQATPELGRLARLVESIEVGMLTTIGPDGSLRSRPLHTREVDAQGRLWFFTDADSPKSAEMQAHDHQVCVTYADARGSRYASISGTGRVARDRDRMIELWSPKLETWFPRGMEDPDLALLEVRIDKAEFWDGEDVKTSGPRTAAPGDEAR
jgi:general stress protein 26